MSEPVTRRVLWVHQNFVSRAHAGNERPVLTIAAMLEQGWHVDLITGTTGYQGTELTDKGALRTEGRLSWHRIDNTPAASHVASRGASYASFLRGASAITRRLPRPDLVFASTPPLPHAALSLRHTFQWNVPLILEVRDLWPAFLEALGLVRNRAALSALAALESLAYRSASAVVSVSPAFRPYLEGMGVHADAILDAPHSARPRDVEGIRTAGATWRRHRNLEGLTVLLYAGSLNESHGIARIMEAAAATEAERMVWVIAGGGRQQQLVQEAERRGRNVLYLGAVPRRELDPLFGACDVSIVSLDDQAFFSSVLPGKLVDSLASGVPVICCVPGQAAALVESAGAGWTCSPTVRGLLDTARRVAAMPPAMRREMGDAGHAFVRRRLSAETQGRAIARLCGSVVERNRGTRRRLVRAIPPAARDAMTRRAHRLAVELFGDAEGEGARRSFEKWLADAREVGQQPALNIPSLFE